MFAIKTEVRDPHVATFTFAAQKTMYGGKAIGEGDAIFIFASENEGGAGLVACGIVTRASVVPKPDGVDRWTPRASITVRRTELARRPLGRAQLKGFTDWTDERPETELNFKLYRQATDKIVGISDRTGAFLRGYF